MKLRPPRSTRTYTLFPCTSLCRSHAACADIRDFLAETAFLAPEDFSDHLYVHYEAPAVAHLFSVAAGLDSAVLGESEVLGQVKTAWEHARAEGAAGPALNLLFRHALEAGQRARSDKIGRASGRGRSVQDG